MSSLFSTPEPRPYTKGTIQAYFSCPEIAGGLYDIKHFGINYNGQTFSFGEWKSAGDSGYVESRLTSAPFTRVSSEEALRIIREEIQGIFKPEIIPKITIEIMGKVVQKGKSLEEKV